MQSISGLSGVRPCVTRQCRTSSRRVQALSPRDQAQQAATPASLALQVTRTAGLLAAAVLLTATPAWADARDFELSEGERKVEAGLEDTIRSRGGAVPSAPETSPGYKLIKNDRKGPSDNEIRNTQEIGKASPPPPKRQLAAAPAPEKESPIRRLFGGLFNRPRSEAARTAAAVATPTGNSPVNVPNPGQLGEQAKQAAGSVAETLPSAEGAKSQAKEAASTVAESAPSTEGIKSQAKEAASIVAESAPSAEGVKSQAQEAVSTVADSAPSAEGVKSQAKEAVSSVAQSGPAPGPASGGDVISSGLQGVEAVTENADKQGPDAVPDQPQEGTAVQAVVQGEEQTPGVAGPTPAESVTDKQGVPNDPLKVSTESAMPNDPLNISSQSSIPMPLDTIADASMAAEDTSNPFVAKLRGAVESIAPSAADTAKKAEPLSKGIEAGEKNFEQQSPLESTPLEPGETQAAKGKDVAAESD